MKAKSIKYIVVLGLISNWAGCINKSEDLCFLIKVDSNKSMLFNKYQNVDMVTVVEGTELLLVAGSEDIESKEFCNIEALKDYYSIEFFIDYSTPIYAKGRIIKQGEGFLWVLDSLSHESWSYIIPSQAKVRKCIEDEI